MEALGIESRENAEFAENRDDSRTDDAPRVDVSARTAVASGPRGMHSATTVEDALARAIEGAVAAGRWDVVAQLARELEARRLAAASDVVALDPAQLDAPLSNRLTIA